MRSPIPLSYLVFLMIFGGLSPVMAQLTQLAPPPPPRDTAYAMHNLFRKHRSNELREAGYGTAGLTSMEFELAHGQSDLAVGLGLISMVPTALGPGSTGAKARNRRAAWCGNTSRGGRCQQTFGGNCGPGISRACRYHCALRPRSNAEEARSAMEVARVPALQPRASPKKARA